MVYLQCFYFKQAFVGVQCLCYCFPQAHVMQTEKESDYTTFPYQKIVKSSVSVTDLYIQNSAVLSDFCLYLAELLVIDKDYQLSLKN